MASKRIDELTTRVVINTDLLPPTPSGGPSGSATVAATVKAGLSQPNSASAGAGADVTIKAADGVTSGAGGNITITPGVQATTGGNGKVVIDTLTVGLGKGSVATNTAVGASALASNTTGSLNTAVGASALEANTTAEYNTAVGYVSGKNLTSGGQNTYVGAESGRNTTTGSGNTGIGRYALGHANPGDANSAVGQLAAWLITGNYNVAFGAGSLRNAENASNNVALGFGAARYQADGSTSLTTTNNSIYIGYDSRGYDNSDSNTIVIGYQGIGEGANTVVLGNSSIVQQHIYATRYIKTEGSLAFASSTPAAVTANQNNYVLTGSAFQRINCTTASNITGIAPPTSGAHVDGRMIRIVSVGTDAVTLKHNDAGSDAANRMYMASGADMALATNAWAELVYDSTDNGSGAAGWRVY